MKKVNVTIEVYRKEKQKYLNIEVILISEFMNPEIRITSTFRHISQAEGCQNFFSKNLYYMCAVFQLGPTRYCSDGWDDGNDDIDPNRVYRSKNSHRCDV